MSQPKQGSIGVAIGVCALVVLSIGSIGYYQFMYCPQQNQCSNSTFTTSAPTCAPPSCVTIAITFGASTLTDTAYSPDSVKLVVGVNNTFQFVNNDSQGGGVFHSATAKTCPQNCPFDTGIVGYNVTKGPYTITVPGTYPYFCTVHPTTMVGTIVVVAGTGGSGGAPSSSSSRSSSTASSSSSSAPANGLAVSIYKGADSPSNPPGFRPDKITVVVGVNNTLTWTNNDASAHTVTSTSVPAGVPTFNSGIMAKGGNFTLTLTAPGTYEYICSLHPTWMKGTIIVKSR